MKTILSVLVVCAMLFLVACSGNGDNGAQDVHNPDPSPNGSGPIANPPILPPAPIPPLAPQEIPRLVYVGAGIPIGTNTLPNDMHFTSGTGFVNGFNNGTIAGMVITVAEFMNRFDDIADQDPKIVSMFATGIVNETYDFNNAVILVIGNHFVNQHGMRASLQERLFEIFADNAAIPAGKHRIDRNRAYHILVNARTPLNMVLLTRLSPEAVVSLYDNRLVLPPEQVQDPVDRPVMWLPPSGIAGEDVPPQPIYHNGVRFYGLTAFLFTGGNANFLDNINLQMQHVVDEIVAAGTVNVIIRGHVWNYRGLTELLPPDYQLSRARAEAVATALRAALRADGRLPFNDNDIRTEAVGIAEFFVGGGAQNRSAAVFITGTR